MGVFIYISIFFFIIFSNFIGLFPYNNLFAHLVPKGTPGFLIPIMVIIETVRNIIRPLTLLGSQIPNVRSISFLVLFFFFISIIIIRGICSMYSIICIYDSKFFIFK